MEKARRLAALGKFRRDGKREKGRLGRVEQIRGIAAERLRRIEAGERDFLF